VRALILELRDRGCTVVFSSHILSDAEALCSRVAILDGGRMVSSGRLNEILAFGVHGWEVVLDRVEEALRTKLEARASRTTTIAEGRLTLELPADGRPEELLAEAVAGGATIVSLNPMRETLEDYFMRQVAEHGHQRAVRE
jgi:ABC-2 type transport system ATP-binding protein